MQTRNPLLDEFAKITTSAMGLAQAAGEEASAAFRAQADRFAAEMDLVRKDELEALQGRGGRACAPRSPPFAGERAPAKLASRTKPVEPGRPKRIGSSRGVESQSLRQGLGQALEDRGP